MRLIDADAIKEKFAEILESTYTGDYAKGFVNGLCAALNMPTITPPNEPLTFAELREMEGEPVWVEHNNGGEWLVIHWDYVGRITTAYKACLLDHEYGRTWLAYCHPPEEETDE